MKNLPKQLQTRADFEEAVSLSVKDNSVTPALISQFKGLLELAYKYEFDRILQDGESADGEMPEYVVVEKTDSQDSPRHQLKRVVDDSSRLFALGYDIDSVKIIINKLENQ